METAAYPSEGRFSLSLDLSEIFKPVIVDRLVFNLVSKRIVSENDSDDRFNGIVLNEDGKRNKGSQHSVSHISHAEKR